VDWEQEPVYVAANHSLEWSIRAQTASGRTINHTVVLLARRGVLDVTAIQQYQGSLDVPAFTELLKNITFKNGESYTDYQSGDKSARVSLAELIVNDESPAGLNAGRGTTVLAGSFIAGAALMISGLFLSRKRWMPKRNIKESTAPTSTFSPVKNGNGSGSRDFEKALTNGHNGSRRKRVYDYHKFYTSMILELSSPSYIGGGTMLRNGKNNGKSLNGNGHQPSQATGADQTIISANLELIASQKNLIEEQKRLMQQQSKLIDEKNQLIDDQNQLLERQSEIMENQFSLKLP
jgi:hypothetical protein